MRVTSSIGHDQPAADQPAADQPAILVPSRPAPPPPAGRDTKAYYFDSLDGIFNAHVANRYLEFSPQYMGRLRLIDKEDTGRRLLNQVADIGRRHGRCPVLDFAHSSEDHAAGAPSPDGTSLMQQACAALGIDHGEPVWDPLYLPLDPDSPDYDMQYKLVEMSLVELCRRLKTGDSTGVNAQPETHPQTRVAHSPGAGPMQTPPFRPRHFHTSPPTPASQPGEPSSPAEAPALAEHALPVWKGKTKVLKLPAVPSEYGIRVSKTLGAQRADLLKVLDRILRNVDGSYLFEAFETYARLGGILIMAEGNGKSGLTTTKDGTLVWLFDKDDLGQRCKRYGLFPPDKPIYSAFVDLIEARDMLREKLGFATRPSAGDWFNSHEGIDRFYDSIRSDKVYDGFAPTPPDPHPGPFVTVRSSQVVPHRAIDLDETSSARRPSTSRGKPATAAASSRVGAPHGFGHRIAEAGRSLLARAGLGRAPTLTEETRPRDVLVGTVPDDAVPDPYASGDEAARWRAA